LAYPPYICCGFAGDLLKIRPPPQLTRRRGGPGELGAHAGQLRRRRPLRVGPGNQQPVRLQSLEALGEDVSAIPADLAEQVIEPLRPAEQRLDQR
jgi:hypothetical protein